MELGPEQQRCLEEIFIALGPYPLTVPRYLMRKGFRLTFPEYRWSTDHYPPEYYPKLQRALDTNPQPIVRIALERLVRSGYPDLALRVQTFLHQHAAHLLEE